MALNDEKRNALIAALEDAVQDANGKDVYSNTKALLGYLEPAKYLFVPKSTKDACVASSSPPVDLKVLGKRDGINSYVGPEMEAYRNANPFQPPVLGNTAARSLLSFKITAMNYVKLLEANVSATDAFVAAALRARWIDTGALCAYAKDSVGEYPEVVGVHDDSQGLLEICNARDYAAVAVALGDKGAEFYEHYMSPTHGRKWVIRHAENIWAAVEHAFRVRGHHCKDTREEYDSWKSLYSKFLTSCFEGTNTWPDGLDLFVIAHTAIHPFRVFALPVMSAHYCAHGKVANAGIIRFSGAPVGNAVITTAFAALGTLGGESWYPFFERVYSTQIKVLASATEQILNDKYSYHNSARLYNLTKKTTVQIGGEAVPLETVKSMTSAVCAACAGLISALHASQRAGKIPFFALRNAKALDKAAGNGPLIALRVRTLILRAIDEIDDAEDMNAAIEGALPTLAITDGKVKSSDDAD